MLSLVQKLWKKWEAQPLSLKIFSGFTLYLTVRYVKAIAQRKYAHSPPGEIGIPFFGSFISIALKAEKFYINIARNTNHPLYMVSLGLSRQCIINDAKLAKQILSMKGALSRPKRFGVLTNANLSQINGAEWKSRRKFVQTNLMTLLNKSYVQENMKHLLNKVIYPKLNHCAKTQKLYYCRNDILYVTFNSMYNAVFGEYLERKDPLYLRWTANFQLYLNELLPHILRYLFFGEPLTTYLRYKLPIIFNKLDMLHAETINILREMAKKAHLRYNKDNILTYYDSTYHELSQNSTNHCWESIITDKVLSDMDLAIEGGSETMGSTLEYCIAIAAKYEYIQDEIYDEIVTITNNVEDYNLYSNLLKFPKLRAFVEESLRLMPILPTGVIRVISQKDGLRIVLKNTEYVLPENCIIVPNIIGMQRDPKYWKDPELFDIKRWLDVDGKFTRKNNPFIMNFTYGARDCLGKSLALKSMYLIIAMLFSKYRFYVDDPDKMRITVKSDFGIHVYPEIGVNIKIRS